VVSGATIGTWQHRPLAAEAQCEKHRLVCQSFAVPLAYRADLPNRQETESQRDHWQREEQAAHARGDVSAARDARAQAERMTRQLSRLRGLPPGEGIPVPVTIWHTGDASWVFLAGEYYNLLQRSLRERFAGRPIFVSTISNGWLPGYVPTQGTYGRGIYQESIATTAPGSLERMIEAIGERLTAADRAR
jgi:hypothetical protein